MKLNFIYATRLTLVQQENKRSWWKLRKKFSHEEMFFEKQPIVVLERCNILPFLSNLRVEHKKNGTYVANDNSEKLGLHFNKLSLKCSVVLVRDDLEKLKYYVNNQNSKTYTKSFSKIGMLNLICSTCKKVYKSIKRLQNHQAKKHFKVDNLQPPKRVSFSEHVTVHEVQEYHRCKKCTKIFKDYECLKLHIKQIHKKRKCYVCNYCSKKFSDRSSFKTHIKLHCDSCGLFLPNKAQCIEHRRNVCRNVKLYNCKTCKENYFKFMDLKDHSYVHISACFLCDICKDQFESKCATAHHISFLHSGYRPEELYITRNLGSDRLYLCNFCDESSVEKEVIESHISLLPDLSNRTMTGYKDYYFCDHCLKKFDTETDMLQHKWSHFLKTSDNSQLRKNDTSIEEPKIRKVYHVNKKNPIAAKDNDKWNKQIEYRPKNGLLAAMLSNVAINKVPDINNGSKNVPSDAKQFSSYQIRNKRSCDLINLPINSEQSSSHEMSNEQSADFNIVQIDYSNPPMKPIVDPKSKKTIISRFNCEICGKYYSSNYTLMRHKTKVHYGKDELKCNICDEIFVWPALVQSHQCTRMNIPEVPFDDARPEIQFDNLLSNTPNGFGEFNMEDDCMVGVDFDIPAPIVELTEYDHQIITDPTPEQYNQISSVSDLRACMLPLQNLGYKIVMQEVPIEF